jgi:hypothetical protein
MNEVIVFPDAASIVIAQVKSDFTARSITAEIGTKLPTPLPNVPFVRIFRTGGLDTHLVLDNAQLTIESYAEDTGTAHDIAQLVRALVHSYRGKVLSGVPIAAVQEFAGPQDFPDPLTNKPRYSFTIQVATRGAAA